jgi:BASS family bile acid:Na+ symporter
MAVSPAPPLVPGKLVKLSGDKSYAYGLYAALILLSVVVVPLSVEIVAWLISSEVSIPPLAAARNVALTALSPLALGQGVQALAPATARRLAPVIYRGALILLLLAILPILARTLPAILELAGGGGLLFMAAVVLIALTGGAALAGPRPEHRAALAAAAATRHPGIALLIAKGDSNDSQVPAAVIAFLLVSLLVAVPFQAVLKRWAIGRLR